MSAAWYTTRWRQSLAAVLLASGRAREAQALYEEDPAEPENCLVARRARREPAYAAPQTTPRTAAYDVPEGVGESRLRLTSSRF